MQYSRQSEGPARKKCDYVLVIVLGIIIVTGLVILYSTSAYNGEIKFQDSFYYLKKQVFATLLGITGMWIIAKMDYHIWKKWAVPGYLLSLLLGIAVLLFGDEYNDIAMLKSVPYSFAMAHAKDGVKQAAAYETERVETILKKLIAAKGNIEEVLK